MDSLRELLLKEDYMISKLFEVRDHMTFIVCIGTLMRPITAWEDRIFKNEHYLLRRAGFAEGPPYSVLFSRAAPCDEPANYDPFAWKGSRTIGTAHLYVTQHWDELQSGAVIDVEFILGETKQPKVSEKLM